MLKSDKHRLTYRLVIVKCIPDTKHRPVIHDNQEDQKKTVVIAQREYDDYIHDLRDSFNGLDLEYAVTAHLKKWKYKLEKSIEEQNTKEYVLSLVSSDHNCALGKWIHNQAKEFYSDCEHSEIDIAKMKIKREFARCSDAV